MNALDLIPLVAALIGMGMLTAREVRRHMPEIRAALAGHLDEPEQSPQAVYASWAATLLFGLGIGAMILL